MSSNLKIDAGNSRIKWSWQDFPTSDIAVPVTDSRGRSGVVSSRTSSLSNELNDALRDVPTPDAIWVSCVGSERIRLAIASTCTTLWNLNPVFLEAENETGGVSNCYREPRTLGVDRWAALVAARSLCGNHPVVVVDAGTAITVDYLEQSGRFSGGVIFPGLETMLESLSASTGNLKGRPGGWRDAEKPSWLNDNSADAVCNGVSLAAISTIDSAVSSHLARDDFRAETIVTGGDGDIIRAMSSHQMQHIPDLVLIGVQLMGQG